MQLHLIFAKARNGVIGKDNALPWHLPEDMAHFKRVTMGCPVIMGRKTWDSIPARFRPLPGRVNVVVSRQPGWNETGAKPSSSLREALSFCEQFPDVWVIGGAELYAQALPCANTAVVTEIDADFDGDAFAPQFGPAWLETARETHTSVNGLRFSFVTYRNPQPQPPAQGS
ncbi:MAG: dihydrofolate reductase [Burkholderiales bacterium]|nr:dihydrofolate reductase [Burkholderiales bacterium]